MGLFISDVNKKSGYYSGGYGDKREKKRGEGQKKTRYTTQKLSAISIFACERDVDSYLAGWYWGCLAGVLLGDGVS